jgi:two-component system OmpR family response regulator
MKALLVEDDLALGQSLMRALKDEGYRTDWVRTVADAYTAASSAGHSVILLDLGLPDGSGLSVLQHIRSIGTTTPVVILSAADELEARLSGLDAGADDFLLKPFEVKELFARIRVVLRRQAGSPVSIIGDDNTRLNLDTRELTYEGHTGRLSVREFTLMMAFLERPGMILSRDQLENRLYGWGEEVESNAVDVLIHYIRKRFGAPIIQNVRGLGWTVVTSPNKAHA